MKNNVQVNVSLIKNLRRSLGLSQSDMAAVCLKKRLNVALSTIKRVESGKSVSLRTLRNIALFHQCSVEELILDKSEQATDLQHEPNVHSCMRQAQWPVQPTFDICGYDFELEQFKGILTRTQTLCLPHMVCLKSEQYDNVELLASLLVRLCEEQKVVIHNVMINEKHQAWFAPLQQLTNAFYFGNNDYDRSTEIRSHFSIENKVQQWLLDIVQITQVQKAPRVVFLNRIDAAQPLFFSCLANLFYLLRQLPILFVFTSQTQSKNLAALQRNLTIKVPKLTIELPSNVISDNSVAIV